MPKLVRDLEILENAALSKDYRLLVLRSTTKVPEILPGQFAEILVPDQSSVFLRRPFSIHNTDPDNNTISFLIKVLGNGTRSIAALPSGSLLNVIFPLGKGFSLPHSAKVLLIGGGCGIAPLLFLAKHLNTNKIEISTILGARGKEDIVELADFEGYGKTFITTEDGSLGHQGLVTQHPECNDLTRFDKIYACGPEPMLRVVASQAAQQNVECEVSLENTMACGIGACLCCVVETQQGNQCVCTVGPVFNTKDLKGWNVLKETGETCPV